MIHELDLDGDGPVTPTALELGRATVEAIAGPFPDGWSAQEVVLVGTGRRVPPDGIGALADRLPALG